MKVKKRDTAGNNKKTAGIILLVIGITGFILSLIITVVAGTMILEEALTPIFIGVFVLVVAFLVAITGVILFSNGLREERKRSKCHEAPNSQLDYNSAIDKL
jgi:heme/copper-type cytochrome/quinol oxidase subunit 4